MRTIAKWKHLLLDTARLTHFSWTEPDRSARATTSRAHQLPTSSHPTARSLTASRASLLKDGLNPTSMTSSRPNSTGTQGSPPIRRQSIFRNKDRRSMSCAVVWNITLTAALSGCAQSSGIADPAVEPIVPIARETRNDKPWDELKRPRSLARSRTHPNKPTINRARFHSRDDSAHGRLVLAGLCHSPIANDGMDQWQPARSYRRPRAFDRTIESRP